METYPFGKRRDPLCAKQVALFLADPQKLAQPALHLPKNKKNKRLCQFSWYCDGKPDIIRNKRVWRECVYVAKYVILGGVPDITYNSTHYHADYVYPWWAKKMEKTVKLGDHIFYR